MFDARFLSDTIKMDSTVSRLRTLTKSIALALPALVGATVAVPVSAQTAPPVVVEDGVVGYVKGRILVKARPGMSPAAVEKELRAHGGKAVGRIKGIDVDIVELPANANEEAVVRLLSKNPRFKFAELDLVVKPAVSTNDPSISSMWHIGKVNAPTAWDISNGTGVTIAVLDTGVNGAHPDLAANIVPGWNIFDNNADTADVFGHGTDVAGVAAMVGNNLVGGAGLAWKAKIMPIRISGLDGRATFSAMASGVTWAADRGARVANISYQSVAGSSTVSSAAAYLRSKGGVVVVAAGNTGQEQFFAEDANLTAVSATDGADVRASWSSFGKYVDLAAPGVSLYTTNRSGGYANASGTSFASPLVAGVYALMISANPQLTPAQLDQAVFSTALDLGTAGKDSSFGHGRVNAAAAVNAARSVISTDVQAPSVAITSPASGSTIAGVATIDVSASDASGVASVELFANSKLVGTDLTAPYQFALDTSTLPDGAVALVAKAKDAKGNVGTSSTVNVTVGNDTIAPTVTIGSPAAGAVVSGTVNVSVSATDNKAVSRISLLIDGKEVAVSYGSSLSYSWSVSGGTTTSPSTKKRGKTSTTSTTTSGTSTLTARAFDAAGNVGSASVTVTRQ